MKLMEIELLLKVDSLDESVRGGLSKVGRRVEDRLVEEHGS